MKTKSSETDEESDIKRLRLGLVEAKKRCQDLEAQLSLEKFGIERFSKDDSLILFYTGFTSYKHFYLFYRCVEPNAKTMVSAYYQGTRTFSLAGRKRNMLLIDELFMFLCRLRVGLLEQDLGVRFNCSISTVSRKIITWVNFLYMVLGRIPLWMSQEAINECMPECFKVLYTKTRVVIDCTEIKTQQPSSLVLNSQKYSNYKGTCTFQCLLGVAPHGLITFVSSLYTVCMSDVEITKLSGLLELLESGDDVMAYKHNRIYRFKIKKYTFRKGSDIEYSSIFKK
jgi:hypothetical protein